MLVELAVVQTQNFDVLTSKWWIQNAKQHIFRFTYNQNQRIAWFEITPPQLTRAFPTPTLCSIACTFCLRYDLTTQPRATYLYGELDLFARLLGASCFEIRAYTQKQRSVSGSERERRKWNERCICITQFFELGAQRRRLIFQNAKHRVMNWMWLLSYLSLRVCGAFACKLFARAFNMRIQHEWCRWCILFSPLNSNCIFLYFIWVTSST